MTSPSRRGRPRPTIVILVLLTITILTLDFRDVGFVRDARSAAATALSPLQGAAEWVGTPFTNAWNGIMNYNDVSSENEQLRAALEALETEVIQMREAEQLIPRLEELLDDANIPWLGDIPTMPARIVQQPANSFTHLLVIDKGSSSGIAVGMPVTTAAGLVGRIVEVESGRSWVQLITDPEVSVGVRLVSSQQVGTATGRGSGRTLRVDTGIEPGDDDAEITDGETLTTSGIDNRSPFPAMIPVAEVSRVREVNGGLNLELFARPVVDMGTLSLVNVLLWTPVP